MSAPYWLVGLVVIAACLSAVIVSMLVSIRSTARGDSLPKMWAKQGCSATLAMFGIFAAYYAIFHLVALFAG